MKTAVAAVSPGVTSRPGNRSRSCSSSSSSSQTCSLVSRVFVGNRQSFSSRRTRDPSSPTAATAAATVPMPNEDPDIADVLYSTDVIEARVNELAADIRRDYADKEPVFLPVMTGAFMFSADLLRAIRPPIKGTWVESVKAKSYFGTETTGDVKVNEITVDVKGRHVLLIEDIVDTGLTLEALKVVRYVIAEGHRGVVARTVLEGRVLDAGAASVAIITLLNKKSRRRNGMQPDYEGFECEDKFVVGYGLDFDSKYRELPYIGVLKPEVYEN